MYTLITTQTKDIEYFYHHRRLFCAFPSQYQEFGIAILIYITMD